MSFDHAVVLAGLGQLALALASTTFPRAFGWRQELARLRPLLRSMFWIYAAYILSFNVAFGLVSALRPQWLLDGSPLAAAVTGFIALYWNARLLLQFTAFDRRDLPGGPGYRAGEAALVLSIAFFGAVYAAAFWSNLRA
jgi:hypothetical protein